MPFKIAKALGLLDFFINVERSCFIYFLKSLTLCFALLHCFLVINLFKR